MRSARPRVCATAVDVVAVVRSTSVDTPGAFDYGFARIPKVDPADPQLTNQVTTTTSDCQGIEHTQQGYARSPDYGPFWQERDYVRQQAERAEQWLGVADSWPAEWVDALGLNDTFVHVTPAQLRALRRDLDAVVARYRHAGDGDPDARRIALTDFSRPVDLDPPAPPDPSPEDPR